MKKFLSGCPVGFTPRVILYPIMLIFSLIFSQLLRQPVTHMLFVFIALLPLGSVVTLLIAALSVHVSFRVSAAAAEKHEAVRLLACISNKGPFPIMSARVKILMPDKRGAVCGTAECETALTPFASCCVEKNIVFSYCGIYRVGVTEVRICDIFRAVTLRIPCKCGENITVLPRKNAALSQSGIKRGVADASYGTARSGSENAEMYDTRFYLPGDSARRIHWKLSSKSEELIVRDMSEGDEHKTLILCDLSMYRKDGIYEMRVPRDGMDDIIDIAAADEVIEAAVAVAVRELSSGRCTVLGFIENGVPTILTLHSEAMLDRVLPRLAAIRTSECGGNVRAVMRIAENEGVGRIITVSHDISAAEVITSSAAIGDDEMIFCACDEIFIPNASYSEAIAEWADGLRAGGCFVIYANEFLRK